MPQSLIERRSQPFAGSPAVLTGFAFSDLQYLLLNQWHAEYIGRLMGVRGLKLPYCWAIVGTTNQLSPLIWQKDLYRLILPISGSALCISLDSRPDSLYVRDVVSFRLVPGSSEAVWIPPAFAAGFYFQKPNTILLAAGSEPPGSAASGTLDLTNPKLKADLNKLLGAGAKLETMAEEIRIRT